MSVLGCSCCDGIKTVTPELVVNRSGLSAIRFRVGTHTTFLESMKGRLSSLVLDIPQGEGGAAGRVRPLDKLRAREATDWSIALLDAWSCIADVLTFYQERIANEGYLRTATERRSIVELANLIGYRLRPGVASSVHLAFTLDKGYETTIPAGTRAQSIPAPGETMQTFETSQPLEARTEWNNLAPRLGRPQAFDVLGAAEVSEIYLKGTATLLQKGDALLLVVGDEADNRVLRFVGDIDPQPDDERTRILLQPIGAVVSVELVQQTEGAISGWIETAPSGVNARAMVAKVKRWRTELNRPFPAMSAYERARDELMGDFEELEAEAAQSGWVNVEAWASAAIDGLKMLGNGEAPGNDHGEQHDRLTELLDPLSIEPRFPLEAIPDVRTVFTRSGGGVARSLTLFRPALRAGLYAAWKRLPSAPSNLEVYAMRVKVSPFGYNAPKQPLYRKENHDGAIAIVPEGISAWAEWTPDHEDPKTLFLESSYDSISSGGYAAIIDDDRIRLVRIVDARNVSRTAYGLSTRTTRLRLSEEWYDEDEVQEKIGFLRRKMVYAASEKLETIDAPIHADVSDDTIELSDLLEGLEAGRAVIVSGERTLPGLPDGTGVHVSELALLAGVQQGVAPLDASDPQSPPLPGDRVHTTLVLTNPLTFTYKRSTVVVYGNVAKATHGETRSEIIGSGDATKAFQAFSLRQFPLTHVSGRSTTGEMSSLAIRVNDVLWHEAEGFPELGSEDRSYVERQDDEQKTIVTFGDGFRGSRLPTGYNNVVGTMRIGIGKQGNVPAEAISLLSSKPLGVRDVINPLPATGGANREGRDQGRASMFTARFAMGRLVSVKDYEAFSTTFAGIGKASARRLPLGRRFVIHVTIAGAEDIPIDPASELFSNLLKALRDWGDPNQAVQLSVRELILPVVSANVRIHPDREWVSLESEIRSALETEFGFERRAIGQPLAASEILAVIQSVPGVLYVDVDMFRGITQSDAIAELSRGPADKGATALLPNLQHIHARRTREQASAQSAISVGVPRLSQTGSLVPGQIAYVRGDMPSAIALKEITL